MEPHPHAWLRSRVHDMYTHAAADGLHVTVLRRSAYLLGEAALFREAPEWEMAGFRDDILLRDGAGRDELGVTVLRRSASLFGEAALFRDEPEDGTGRDEPEVGMAVIGDGVLLRHGTGRDEPEVGMAGIGDGILLRHGAGRDEPEVGMSGIRDDILLRHGAGRGVRFDTLVAREGIPVQLKRTSRDGVLLQDTGTIYVVFMASEPGDGARQRQKKAAADIFLALGDRGDWMDRPMLAVELGPMYWLQELTDWVYRLMGSPRYRRREGWSWLGVVGHPIEQDDDTCVICASLVCLEAQHRLGWERRYGYGTFPYRIPAETVADMKDLCLGRGVWTAEYGANEEQVLELFQEEGGCAAAADVPGWKPCKLQVEGKTYHRSSKRQPMAASKLTRLIHEEGPLLGAIVVDKQTYYAQGWQHRVYRGLPTGHKGGGGHLVLCTGYRDHPTGRRHGHKTELLIEVMETHAPDGPVRWIAANAFKGFCQIHVEPLNATELRN